jgi:hypothetical protein
MGVIESVMTIQFGELVGIADPLGRDEVDDTKTGRRKATARGAAAGARTAATDSKAAAAGSGGNTGNATERKRASSAKKKGAAPSQAELDPTYTDTFTEHVNDQGHHVHIRTESSMITTFSVMYRLVDTNVTSVNTNASPLGVVQTDELTWQSPVLPTNHTKEVHLMPSIEWRNLIQLFGIDFLLYKQEIKNQTVTTTMTRRITVSPPPTIPTVPTGPTSSRGTGATATTAAKKTAATPNTGLQLPGNGAAPAKGAGTPRPGEDAKSATGKASPITITPPSASAASSDAKKEQPKRGQQALRSKAKKRSDSPETREEVDVDTQTSVNTEVCWVSHGLCVPLIIS